MMGRMGDAVKHLLIINIIFFVLSQEFALDERMYHLFSLWFPENPNFKYWQIVTHMFMHGGLMHIVFNMYALWAFGSPLEQMWGRNRFLLFYITAGLGAALIHTAVNYYHFGQGLEILISEGLSKAEVLASLNSGDLSQWVNRIDIPTAHEMQSSYLIPAVGASGAVYGILVAFGMMFPNAELMLIFLPVPIKAKYFIPALIGLDLFSGITGYSIFGQGIAHFAHIGGALFGFIMMWYWKRGQFKNNPWDK